MVEAEAHNCETDAEESPWQKYIHEHWDGIHAAAPARGENTTLPVKKKGIVLVVVKLLLLWRLWAIMWLTLRPIHTIPLTYAETRWEPGGTIRFGHYRVW